MQYQFATYPLFMKGSFNSLAFLLFCIKAQEQGRPPERTSRFYVKGALSYLVPILNHCLAKQVILLQVHFTVTFTTTLPVFSNRIVAITFFF